MSFFQDLQQGSFRGVPFGVLGSEKSFGRRVAVHEYPFRDVPWIEDIGRATRRITFTAFLLENDLVYGGGDVIAQQEALIAACETLGSGTLIHPTLGRLTVSVPEDGCRIIERFEEGRYFEVAFTFIESGQRQFPASTTSTSSNSKAASAQSLLATASDYITQAQVAIAQGSSIIKRAVSTVTGFAGQIALLGQDATNLFTSVVDLPATVAASFGRFFAGNTVGFSGVANPIPASAPQTLPALVAAGSQNRAAIAVANMALVASAGLSDVTQAPTAAAASVAALLAATSDPGVGVRLLTDLADFFPDAPTTSSIVGSAEGSMQTAMGDLCRRTALCYLVQASAIYQPSSQDDAANLRDNLCVLLDAEIGVAGDQGDDQTFAAFRSMRAAMVMDLNTRGAALPPTTVFVFAAPLPALVLANRLYQDATRADELISEANPPHPAFMPVTFQALAY